MLEKYPNVREEIQELYQLSSGIPDGWYPVVLPDQIGWSWKDQAECLEAYKKQLQFDILKLLKTKAPSSQEVEVLEQVLVDNEDTLDPYFVTELLYYCFVA